MVPWCGAAPLDRQQVDSPDPPPADNHASDDRSASFFLLPHQSRGCRMLHSSVHHPQTPEDAPPRRSVQLRMLAIFEA